MKEEHMFIALLIITFLVSLFVSFIVIRSFSMPFDRILKRIIADEISDAWLKYLKFAVMVVGVSSGVRIRQLERFITPLSEDSEQRMMALTANRWILEIYRTVIESLQGIAWMLLVFFVVALMAYVFVKYTETRHASDTESEKL
jgi:hypothetical protein